MDEQDQGSNKRKEDSKKKSSKEFQPNSLQEEVVKLNRQSKSKEKEDLEDRNESDLQEKISKEESLEKQSESYDRLKSLSSKSAEDLSLIDDFLQELPHILYLELKEKIFFPEDVYSYFLRDPSSEKGLERESSEEVGGTRQDGRERSIVDDFLESVPQELLIEIRERILIIENFDFQRQQELLFFTEKNLEWIENEEEEESAEDLKDENSSDYIFQKQTKDMQKLIELKKQQDYLKRNDSDECDEEIEIWEVDEEVLKETILEKQRELEELLKLRKYVLIKRKQELKEETQKLLELNEKLKNQQESEEKLKYEIQELRKLHKKILMKRNSSSDATQKSFKKESDKPSYSFEGKHHPSLFDANLSLSLQDSEVGIFSSDKEEENKRSNTECKVPFFAKKLPRTCIPQELTVPTILTFGGINLENPSDLSVGEAVLGFHPMLNRWEYAGKMSEPRNYHTAILIDTQIFIIGGCDPRIIKHREMVATNSVLSYDLRERRWTQCADMSVPRSFHNSVEIDDIIYTLGGRDHEGNILNTMEKYQYNIDTWTPMSSVPYSVMGAAACNFRDCLLIIGGITWDEEDYDSQKIISSVIYYNPNLDSWSDGPELPFPLAYASCTCNANTVWVFGGITYSKTNIESLKSIFVLDVKNERWIDACQLSSPRHAVSAISIEFSSFVIGGVSTFEKNSVTTLDFVEGVGKKTLRLQPLPLPLAGMASIVLKPLISSAYDPNEIHIMIKNSLANSNKTK